MKTKLLGVAAAMMLLGNVSTAFSATSNDFGLLYDAGSYTTFNVPGAALTRGFGINNAGQIVGEYRVGIADFYGFVYSGGTYTALGFPGGLQSHAYGINSSGQVVGVTNSIGGWVYSSGVYTPLPGPNLPRGINDLGQIVGTTSGPSGPQGFLYSGGVSTTLSYPGADVTITNGINNAGQIVGVYENCNACPKPFGNFIYSAGVYTALNTPPAFDEFDVAVSINNTGQILFSGDIHSWIYDISGGTYTPLFMIAGGINDSGQVVGYGPVFSSVPLPAALPLFATGLGALGLLGWRRKRKAQAAA